MLPMMRWILVPMLGLMAVAPAWSACRSGTVRLAAPHAQAGAGLGDVGVSDGVAVVRTDASGHYRLPAPPQGPVFVIKPAGFQVPAGADGLPDFWRGPGHAGACDFVLAHAGPPDSQVLDVLVFSDPQTSNLLEVGYYRDAIVAPLLDAPGAQLGLTLGDVTNDDLSLYPALNAVTSQLGLPWLHVAGNHDLDAGAAHDDASLETFRRVYGPDTFAWEEANALFVGLDNVIHQPGARPAYIGGLRQSQFAFLQAYLAQAPRDRLLVLMVHIPLFDTGEGRETFRADDRSRLFALLADMPHVLVLSGHRHTLQHVFHDAQAGWPGATPLHEFNVGAASGAYWSGVARDGGIPDATMADGTPPGYARLSIQPGGRYALSWHRSAQHVPAADATDAMALHAPRVLRQGAYPAWGVYANVYMGLAQTRVEFRVGDGAWRPMRQVRAPDPRLVLENARDDTALALRGFDRSPEAQPSTHLWRGALPTDLPAGVHAVEVRAFDAWHGEQRAHTQYRLIQADPPSP